MKAPPIPENEHERQRALDETHLIDDGPEARFDRFTRLARQIFSVPISLISLIDGDSQRFKSHQGLEATETPRNISFCGHAILTSSPLIVEDTLKDPRFADNPFVTNTPNIRFYAGVPLHTVNGYRIGTLCLIDTQPKRFAPQQVAMLSDLAATLEQLIHADEIKRQSCSNLEVELTASRDAMASLINNMPGVTYRCLPDEHWTMLYISGQVDRVSGYPAEELIGNKGICYADLIHPDDAPALENAVTAAMANNTEWHLEYRIQHRDGNWRWVEERGKCVKDDARHPAILEGFIVDITREKNTVSQLNKHHDALLLLNDIAFSSQDTLDGKINHALEISRQYLKMDLAILSQIESTVYTVRWMDADAGIALTAGQTFMLGQTWCQLIFSGKDKEQRELFLANAERSKFRNHPCYQSHPLGTYAGIVIEVEGQSFGTLNFSSGLARTESFD
ncbi:GAF domain-containing protein, partial [Vreelandella neptunia]